MSQQLLRIFISYRRADSAPSAGRIYDHLSAQFGDDNVFMDVSDIAPGADFVDSLQEAVQRCDVLLAVIGRDWSSAANENGELRLFQPDDYVRIEIAAALDRGVRVIPLLIDGAPIPRVDQLPEGLHRLLRRNAFSLSNARFRADIAQLVETLKAPPEPPEPSPETASTGQSSQPETALPGTVAVATLGDITMPIFHKGTLAPAAFKNTYWTAKDGQTRFEVHLVYGELSKAADNTSLGKYLVTDVPPAPRGKMQIELTVRVDANLELTVLARAGNEPQPRMLGTLNLHDYEPAGSVFDPKAVDDLFSELFTQLERGTDREEVLPLTREQAANGARVEITVPKNEKCPKCNGSGVQRLLGVMRGICPQCQGHGRDTSPHKVLLQVPPGATEGQRLRLKGKGALAGLPNKPPGDLFLRVKFVD